MGVQVDLSRNADRGWKVVDLFAAEDRHLLRAAVLPDVRLGGAVDDVDLQDPERQVLVALGHRVVLDLDAVDLVEKVGPLARHDVGQARGAAAVDEGRPPRSLPAIGELQLLERQVVDLVQGDRGEIEVVPPGVERRLHDLRDELGRRDVDDQVVAASAHQAGRLFDVRDVDALGAEFFAADAAGRLLRPADVEIGEDDPADLRRLRQHPPDDVPLRPGADDQDLFHVSL